MKKIFILVAMLLLASFAGATRYVPVSCGYSDGIAPTYPDYAVAYVIWNGNRTIIDSLVFSSTVDTVQNNPNMLKYLFDSVGVADSYVGDFTIVYKIVVNGGDDTLLASEPYSNASKVGNDSLNAILDTLQLWDSRIDSLEAALADGSISDKVWVDGTPTIRGEIGDILDTLQDGANGPIVAVGAIGANVITAASTHGDYVTEIADASADSVWSTTDSPNRWIERADSVLNIPDNLITDAKIAGDAIGSEEIATGAITHLEIDPTAAGEIGDSVWAIADRTIERADTVNYLKDMAPDIIGSSELATTAANEIADEVFDEDTASHNTAATYGLLFKDTSAYQGTAASVTLDGIFDTVGQLFQDSLASIDDVWRNRDTTHVDSSDIGVWIANNSGGGEVTLADGAITAAKIATDAITAAKIAADAIGSSELATTAAEEIADSVLKDTSYLATVEEVWYNIDTTNIDSSDLGTWMEANLSAAGQWTSDKVDSVLSAIEDSNAHNKVWHDEYYRVAIAEDSTVRGQYLGLVDYGLNLVRNGGFEEDSVGANTAPAKWALADVDHDNSMSVSSSVGGRWDFRITSKFSGNITIYQNVGWLRPGIYMLSGTMRNYDANSIFLVIDSGAAINSSNFDDSITTSSSTMQEYTKEVTILDSGNYSVGYVLNASSGSKYGDIDNTKLVYVSPLTVVAADTNTSGEEIAMMPEHWADVDSAGFQGDAASVTNASVADAVWDELTADHVTANTFGDSLASMISGGGSDSATVYAAAWDANMAGVHVFSMEDSIAAKIEDSVHQQVNDYKATVTGYSTFDETADNVTINADNADGDRVALHPHATDGTTEQWTTADSTAYKASISLAAADVAGAVVDSAVIRTDLFYGPSATGSGAYTRTFVVVDSTGWETGLGTALSNVPYINMSIYDTAQAVLQGDGETYPTGRFYYNLDTGIYAIVPTLPGYTFPGDDTANFPVGVDTIHVTGTGTDTIWCYHANTNMTSVWGNVKSFIAGNIEDVTVTFALTKRNMQRDSDSGWVAPVEYSTTTDASGNFSLSVYASTGLFSYGKSPTTDSIGYRVSFKYNGGEWGPRSKVYVPNQTSWQFQKTE